MSLRWLSAADYQTELRCSGNEVAVGSCSGGGWGGNKDCPGKLPASVLRVLWLNYSQGGITLPHLFFPGRRNNCEKISLYLSLKEVENCLKLHFFGNKLSRLSFLWVKIVKICKLRGKD